MALLRPETSDGVSNKYGFFTGSKVLAEEGVEEFRFNHFVRFEDNLGNVQLVQVFPFNRDVSLDEPEKYEMIWKQGGLTIGGSLDVDLTEEFDLK